MLLREITLTNFGVFPGVQRVALLPKKGRPITLIGGKNGAGKTTLLEAIRLCFYGPEAAGLRSKDEYIRYLDRKIHTNPGWIIQPNISSVSVEFEYSDIDAVRTYKIVRSWEKRTTGKIAENLSLERDGKPLDDIAAEHWPEFVRDLIPPGVSQLFFFDGEKIQNLAEDSSDQQALAESIKSLLGLDIVESLESDLAIYRSRLTKSSRNGDGTKVLQELETEMQCLREQLQQLHKEREVQAANISELKLTISRQHERIATQGGSFARNRERLLQQQAMLQTRIAQSETSLRDLCAGLLPFALVPQLCQQLRDSLLLEQEAAQLESAIEVLKTTETIVCSRLNDPGFWHSFQLPEAPHASVVSCVKDVFEEVLSEKQTGTVPLVHQLSASTVRQVLGWADTATGLGEAIRNLGAELERLHRELHKVETELRKVPPDEVLKPLLDELQQVNSDLGEVSKNALLTSEQIKSLELHSAAVQRRHDDLVEKLSTEATQESRLHLVPQIHAALEEFKSALLFRRLAQLQKLVTESFNALCRKKDSIREIAINPTDFSVAFKGRDGRDIPKAQLSAGEKQIYAISMLWGLAKTSGRPLPIIIDTPLGRLDTDHRKLLTQHYFPFASHQVVILSTDSEIDQVYFHDLRKSVAQAYRLDFDGDNSGTRIESGYFWD